MRQLSAVVVDVRGDPQGAPFHRHVACRTGDVLGNIILKYALLQSPPVPLQTYETNNEVDESGEESRKIDLYGNHVVVENTVSLFVALT